MTEDNNSGTTDVEVQKSVQIVAYLDQDLGGSIRSIGNVVHPHKDWWGESSFERTERYISRAGELQEIDRETFEFLEGSDLGEAELVTKNVEESEYKVREDTFTKETLREVMAYLPDELFGTFENQARYTCYKSPEGDRPINFYAYAKQMPLLKHPSNIEPDDKFEDDVERPVMKIKVKMQMMTEEQMEEATSSVIKPLVARLTERDEVERVRWYDCSIKKEEEGQCLNI